LGRGQRWMHYSKENFLRGIQKKKYYPKWLGGEEYKIRSDFE